MKCSAWSPALISSHMKEKEPTFSLANKMGKSNINFCLVLPCRINWEFIPFDFSSLKVCCQQRKRGHQENNSSYILRKRACKQLPPSADCWLEDELWRWIPASLGFHQLLPLFHLGSFSISVKSPMHFLLTYQEIARIQVWKFL